QAFAHSEERYRDHRRPRGRRRDLHRGEWRGAGREVAEGSDVNRSRPPEADCGLAFPAGSTMMEHLLRLTPDVRAGRSTGAGFKPAVIYSASFETFRHNGGPIGTTRPAVSVLQCSPGISRRLWR